MERVTGRLIHPASGRTYHEKTRPPMHEGRDDVTGEPLTRRKDDNAETLRKRLDAFQRQTSPVISTLPPQTPCPARVLGYVRHSVPAVPPRLPVLSCRAARLAGPDRTICLSCRRTCSHAGHADLPLFRCSAEADTKSGVPRKRGPAAQNPADVLAGCCMHSLPRCGARRLRWWTTTPRRAR